MTKNDIRKSMKEKRRSLTETEMELASKEVFRHLVTFEPYRDADTIYCYASYNKELPTTKIIKEALNSGKKVALPKVEEDNIEFYLITDYSQVITGYQGIPEPVATKKAIPSIDKPSLMLLPGLAFTKRGERLGYGGGFYDRYLALFRFGAFITCGIGYDFQVVKTLPVDERDVTIDYVITPKDMIWCSTQERVMI